MIVRYASRAFFWVLLLKKCGRGASYFINRIDWIDLPCLYRVVKNLGSVKEMSLLFSRWHWCFGINFFGSFLRTMESSFIFADRIVLDQIDYWIYLLADFQSYVDIKKFNLVLFYWVLVTFLGISYLFWICARMHGSLLLHFVLHILHLAFAFACTFAACSLSLSLLCLIDL